MTKREFYVQGIGVLTLIAIVALATTCAHAGDTTPGSAAAIAASQGEALKNMLMFLAFMAVLAIVMHVMFPGPCTSDQIQRELDAIRTEELRAQRRARKDRENRS